MVGVVSTIEAFLLLLVLNREWTSRGQEHPSGTDATVHWTVRGIGNGNRGGEITLHLYRGDQEPRIFPNGRSEPYVEDVWVPIGGF